jgi:vacuolar-type H+-ATPase subunit D/Vma8
MPRGASGELEGLKNLTNRLAQPQEEMVQIKKRIHHLQQIQHVLEQKQAVLQHIIHQAVDRTSQKRARGAGSNASSRADPGADAEFMKLMVPLITSHENSCKTSSIFGLKHILFRCGSRMRITNLVIDAGAPARLLNAC